MIEQGVVLLSSAVSCWVETVVKRDVKAGDVAVVLGHEIGSPVES